MENHLWLDVRSQKFVVKQARLRRLPSRREQTGGRRGGQRSGARSSVVGEPSPSTYGSGFVVRHAVQRSAVSSVVPALRDGSFPGREHGMEEDATPPGYVAYYERRRARRRTALDW